MPTTRTAVRVSGLWPPGVANGFSSTLGLDSLWNSYNERRIRLALSDDGVVSLQQFFQSDSAFSRFEKAALIHVCSKELSRVKHINTIVQLKSFEGVVGWSNRFGECDYYWFQPSIDI